MQAILIKHPGRDHEQSEHNPHHKLIALAGGLDHLAELRGQIVGSLSSDKNFMAYAKTRARGKFTNPRQLALSAVRQIQQDWASVGSDEESWRSLPIMQAICTEFNVTPSSRFTDHPQWGKSNEQEQQALRLWAKTTAETTQKFLVDRGINELTLYRGMSFDHDPNWTGESGQAKIKSNPLTSFTAEKLRTRSFLGNERGLLIETKLPIRRVIANPSSGIGNIWEKEVMIIGNDEPDDATVTAYTKAQDKPNVEKSVQVIDVDEGDNAYWSRKTLKEKVEKSIK
jgi:hypothetical protein